MRKIEKAVEEGIREGVAPGIALLVSLKKEVVFEGYAGLTALYPQGKPVSDNTLFDLASLTKVVATVPACALLSQAGSLGLEDRASSFLPQLGRFDPAKEAITIRQILSHSAGFLEYLPLFQKLLEKEELDGRKVFGGAEGRDCILQEIFKTPLSYTPGESVLYSDLGFFLLGEIIGKVSGKRLDQFVQEEVFSPLGMTNTFFRDLEKPGTEERSEDSFAATEQCPWRGKTLRGEVHDDNAYAWGGIAGHSGLFSTLKDLMPYCHWVVDGYEGKEIRISQELAGKFLGCQRTPPGTTWALGWDTPTPGKSTSGDFFSPQSVGHLGYTGTSIWIDLEKKLVVILLTNRVHPSRSNWKIKSFRPYLHNIIYKEVVG